MTPKPLLAACVVCVAFALPPPPKGDPQAVYALVERILPGASGAFEFSLINSCGGADVAQCFVLSDADGEKISIQGVTASDLTAGLGHYLREYVGITLGWTRGGGSNVFQPTTWPKIGAVTQVNRTVPYSYLMNVCTHSYTLVWLSWPEWEHWIDWAALYGVNLLLAYTGQEEIQYKTFQQFGLNVRVAEHPALLFTLDFCLLLPCIGVLTGELYSCNPSDILSRHLKLRNRYLPFLRCRIPPFGAGSTAPPT